MIPEEEPVIELTKEEIEMKLDKIDYLEKEIQHIKNDIEQLRRSNKSQHKRIFSSLDVEEGDNDV